MKAAPRFESIQTSRRDAAGTPGRITVPDLRVSPAWAAGIKAGAVIMWMKCSNGTHIKEAT